jgi:hypothetical protein
MPNYRFGKHPPKADYRTLRFRDYVGELPPPPDSVDTLGRRDRSAGFWARSAPQ